MKKVDLRSKLPPIVDQGEYGSSTACAMASAFPTWASTRTRFECKGKRPYDTKAEVMKDIFRMMKESYGGFGFLRPYRCKYCKKWHFTSSD